MASRKIEDLHQVFQPMVRSLLEKGQAAIKDTGWIFFITDGFRSFAEQTELYASGRTKTGPILTNAKAGQSAHNFGLAVDMAFQKDGKLSYDPTLYAKIYPIARTLGFELGADWVGFVDKPHFEHPNWESLSNTNQGENNMANIYKGLDLSNADSMKVAVDVWDEVVNQKLYVKKVDAAKERDIAVKQAFEDGKNSVSNASQPAESVQDPNPNPSKLELNGAQVVVGPVTFNYKTK